MQMFLISDNIDTYTGMRLAGVEGVVVHERDELKDALEKAIANGETLYETDIETMLQKRRAEMPGYFEDSFSTIAAYGTNAAMMHYHAEGEVNSVIEPHGFLLVDNGGQYDCGTTDITRTYPVGPLTDNERRYYTCLLYTSPSPRD